MRREESILEEDTEGRGEAEGESPVEIERTEMIGGRVGEGGRGGVGTGDILGEIMKGTDIKKRKMGIMTEGGARNEVGREVATDADGSMTKEDMAGKGKRGEKEEEAAAIERRGETEGIVIGTERKAEGIGNNVDAKF